MESAEPLEFAAFRKSIESYPRLSGYYLIKWLSVSDLRRQRCTDDEIAEKVFQSFDDHAWPPPELRPKDQSWADYATDRTAARAEAIACLMGGPPIGHLRATIAEPQAADFFERFDSLFPDPKKYYVGLGLGNLRDFVFSGGVAIIAPAIAGCLWIVEND